MSDALRIVIAGGNGQIGTLHYDLMIVLTNLVSAFTDGGVYVLTR
jgi:hypothetical protein